MSMKSQTKCAKKRSHESLDSNKEQRKHSILSKCDVESRSSSCGSKKSNKKLLKNKSQEGFFNVEKIIGSKIHQGRSFYKVRWQGYNENEDSWEPEDNLMNVLDLIDEFLSNKVDEYEENGRGTGCSRIRSVGGYEYVPSNKVVAHKTKYFDDIRDGKIDLTKNDLYSRVKTRKRLQSDTPDITDNVVDGVDEITNDIIEEPVTPIASNICDKNRYYQSNLFEMTAEFMRNNNFDKGLTALVSKSSTNDDISSFNCSISPHTNQSDDLLPQASPGQLHSVSNYLKKSMATQTDSTETTEEIPVVLKTEIVKPYLQKIMHKIDESLQRKGPPERLVTSESHLLSIYAKEIKLSNKSAIVLPHLHKESDLVSVTSFGDLKTAIILNKYNLLNFAFEGGVKFDLDELFSPENVTPLHLAVSKNQFNIVRLLLRNGSVPDCHWPEHCYESPLMLASSCGYVHVVKALLDYGAFTDCRGHNGKNALCFAIENGRIDVVRMLLQHGTNFFKVAEQQSAMSLVTDLQMSNRLSQIISFDLMSLIKTYQLAFITALNRSVNRYLTKQMAKQSCTIFPYQWIDVIEREYHVDFFLDDSIIVNIDSPILLLVHGVQADCNFEFWIDNNCCCVDSVFVNGERQSSLSNGNFVTTLWPLHANNNRLTVRFTDPSLLSQEMKHIRVAIVALSITNGRNTNNVNNSFHLASHCRQYH